ncbi:GtrA family protein [Modestobacter sp. VKM Ac-2986]|uniref:GtrA family protein n=1 Tax=Modestobacter sp. VKM Ac-2986 TaxID=3004140 RepID=UPI0022AA27A9|nr:GtrA family protein [Modestobacter sp. VKM Ac-2986]MCZ2827814.1 GtrA family protein [Modestobacter sp. VKM Ac-2986]
MTCPSLLRRPALSGVAREHRDDVTTVLQRGRQLLAPLRARLHQDDAGAQFVRFVVVGGVSSALYAVMFIALGGLGDQTANLVGAITSTLVANEMHRRLTFHAGQQVSFLTAQWEGGGLAAIGLVATSLALAGVHTLVGDVGTVAQLGLIAAVTGAIGLVRFIALRSWVFTSSASRP